jgi:hypothetical protein
MNNSINQSPYYHYVKSYYNLIDFQEKLLKDLDNQNDKTLVWIVGFSIGSIGLIISNVEQFNFNINNVICVLLLSIIFGVLGRIFKLFSLKLFIPIWSNHNFPNIMKDNPFSIRKIKEDEKEEMLKLFLLNDFNLNNEQFERICKQYDTRDKLLEAYKNFSEWLKSETNRASQTIKTNYIAIAKISEDDYIKMQKKETYPKTAKILGNVSLILYTSSYFLFILGALLFAFSFFDVL